MYVTHSVCPSSVTKSYPTLCNPIDYRLTGSSVHGISQVRKQEWIAISFSQGLPDPGIEPMFLMSPPLAGGFFTTSTTWKSPILPLDLRKRYGLHRFKGYGHPELMPSLLEYALDTQDPGFPCPGGPKSGSKNCIVFSQGQGRPTPDMHKGMPGWGGGWGAVAQEPLFAQYEVGEGEEHRAELQRNRMG